MDFSMVARTHEGLCVALTSDFVTRKMVIKYPTKCAQPKPLFNYAYKLYIIYYIHGPYLQTYFTEFFFVMT